MRAAETLGTSLLPAIVLIFALFSGSRSPAAMTERISDSPVEAQRMTSVGLSTGDELGEIGPVLDLMVESLGSPPQLIAPDKRKPVVWNQQRLKLLTDAAAFRGHFSFLLATVPDYVDSNTAWMADEIIGAIQAAMHHQGYVLDRFWLPDLPRAISATRVTPETDRGTDATSLADPGPTGTETSAVPAARRSHESQPGVLIFRAEGGWYVVLIALETATSGLHTRAFENAGRFIAQWQRLTNDALKELRVVGPTFSGSVDFMTASLARLTADARFDRLRVISGSATGDSNSSKFRTLCIGLADPLRAHCSYASAMHTTWATMNRLYEFFIRMNPSWYPGRVAILREANTTFGEGFRHDGFRHAYCDEPRNPNDAICEEPHTEPHTYYFPLHISQLRADPRSAPELPKLLTTPAVALRLGESIIPVDQVPPLRPAVASPLTERTMDATLDDIRHEGYAAVGIYATDVRDILYLSREIKRAAPDVQLFYPSAHLLYLYPEFVPYIRGAIVASTYPLRVTDQLWGNAVSSDREVFPSTVAEGVFNATMTQVAGNGRYLPDYPPIPYEAEKSNTYCVDDAELPVSRQFLSGDSVGCPELGPKPGLWLSIVGDDGFWPLEQDQTASDLEKPRSSIERLPAVAKIGAAGISVIVLGHAFALFLMLRTRRDRLGPGDAAALKSLKKIPILNALTPPPALPQFGRLHTLMSTLAFVNISALTFWFGTVVLVWAFGPPIPPSAAAFWLVPALGSVAIVVGHWNVVTPWSTLPQVKARAAGLLEPVRAVEWVVGACYGVPIVALVWSVGAQYWFTQSGNSRPFLAMARTIGGGTVSPAAITVCILATMYVPVIWSLRRLSSLGYGYATLARSRAFGHLLGGPDWNVEAATLPAVASPRNYVNEFAALLDMPTRHLPRAYAIGLLGVMFVFYLALSGGGSTIEGRAFNIFLSVGSLLGMTAALALLAQAVEIWRRIRSLLRAMADLPLWTSLARLSSLRVQWNVSIFAPDAGDLRLPLRLAKSLQRQAGDLRALLSSEVADALGDLLSNRPGERPEDDEPTSLTQSKTFLKLWQLADALMPVLDANRWAPRRVLDSGGGNSRDAAEPATSACLDHCETLLAVQCALVLRDVVARIMSAIFAAMVCLGLLTCAHLFYIFQGRSSYLTLDVIVLGAAALVAIWLLLGMEHDPILHSIWQTTPGRMNFNWGLVQRLTIYGVLPLVIVMASLFPEIGEQVLKWLEPIRKLTML
jgi:hypothetical protein